MSKPASLPVLAVLAGLAGLAGLASLAGLKNSKTVLDYLASLCLASALLPYPNLNQ